MPIARLSCFFFFSSRRRHTRWNCDWSSDVCSSDLIASDAVHDAQSIAPTERKITMEVFDGPGTPEVLGDEARLRQVLGNLVDNAMQHTPENAVITVRVGTDKDNAVLEVCDEGPGMSK